MTTHKFSLEIIKGPSLLSLVLALIMQLPITLTLQTKNGHGIVSEKVTLTNLRGLRSLSEDKDDNDFRYKWEVIGRFRPLNPSGKIYFPRGDSYFIATYDSKKRTGSLRYTD